jgi:uncharacterized heparinase superfamily protein
MISRGSSVRRLGRLAGSNVSTVRRYGFHPLRIGAGGVHRLRGKRNAKRLHEGYSTIIGDPGPTASLRPPTIDVPAIGSLPAELHDAAAALCDEAEAILAHQMDYLGSGRVGLGDEIDWHLDFKSGYRWPVSFYQDLEITRLDDTSDAKVPWELSRGHQLLTLARAACLLEDERFATELELQLESWLASNPPGYGINWVTPMEVAFRAINWIWAIGTLEGWRALEPQLRARVTRSLQVHGRHIALHLEGSPLLRGNHYLADVVGLLALSASIGDDPAVPEWGEFSRGALEREIRTQVLDDGVGFEASLPYHGLALEMFLVAWSVAELTGRPLSERYRARLERMLEVSRSVRHPAGRIPAFGDLDSGRLLPGGFARPITHDNLLDLGAAVLGLPRPFDAPPDAEVAWTFGLRRWRVLAARPVEHRPLTTAFPNGGLYVLEGGGAHMVVRWGGVGQNGNGGHAHNDLSSYELSYGTPIVVDPGSYVYTADPEARDEFRSARAHSLAVVDGLDMHPVVAGEVFRMPAHARYRVEEWRQTADEIVVSGSHDGFRRPGAPVRCRRRITLQRKSGVIEIIDELEGSGSHLVESMIHLSPATEAEAIEDQAVVVRFDRGVMRFEFSGAVSLIVDQGWVSPEYGVRQRAPLIIARADSQLPVRIGYRIVPV